MSNKAFEGWWDKHCTISDLRFLTPMKAHKRTYEAGQRTLPADVEKVLEAVRDWDETEGAWWERSTHWESHEKAKDRLSKAIRNLDKGRK